MPLYYDTPPQSSPIDLTELKDHLRLGDGTAYDNELQKIIDAVSDSSDINCPLQFAYKRQFIKATLVFTTKEFTDKLELPRPPLISVSLVEYRDEEGNWQTVDASNYEVNTDAEPGFIRFLDYEQDTYEYEEYPIRVTYQAGYQSSDGSTSTAEHVPDNVQLWAMNIIGDYFTEKGFRLITNMEVVELKAAMGRLMAPHNAGRRFG